MSRRYSFDSDSGEHTPYDYSNPHDANPTSLRPHADYRDQDPQEPYRDQSPGRIPMSHPGNHPDSMFARSQQTRAQPDYIPQDNSNLSQRVPPAHRNTGERSWGNESQISSITPGADNFGSAAGGGIPGLAMTVAERNARESGLDAMRATHDYQQQQPHRPYPQAYHRGHPQEEYAQDYGSYNRDHDRDYDDRRAYRGAEGQSPYEHGHGSSHHVAAVPVPGAMAYSGPGTPTRSMNSYSGSYHSDPFRDPQMAYGQRMDPNMGQVNPNDIDDDGDDGLEYRRSARNSMLNLANISNRNSQHGSSAAAAGAAGGAAAGGVLGGILGRNRDHSGYYGPVQNPGSSAYPGAGAGAGSSSYDLGNTQEKPSEWLKKHNSSRKKYAWIIGTIVFLIIAGAVAGAVAGVLLNKKSSSGGGGGQSAQQDQDENGDLDINSSEIQDLLNNKNLHKVFPGVDYTPLNAQYPDCLTSPPSQNNVTRDVAVLSQLTNKIRLYGTDCNQTEMVIHAINQLKMQDQFKIWMGVWLEGNQTTNDRQLAQMWSILDTYGDSPFEGLIIGNEVLFRKELSETELTTVLDDTRKNLTANSWSLPVATSDLGANWTPNLAEHSDYIMGNVHPFFSGEPAENAAAWTYNFWTGQIASFKNSDPSKNVIAETGWPSEGGTDCGSDKVTQCPNGAVANIDSMNKMLDTWVCPALANGTNYFWFEMFDEPWKITFDTPGMEWEDHWGILDVNRNLKTGVIIPDCGGKTV